MLLAIDTEFLRTRTYYPMLSIIQWKAEGGNAQILDVLSEENNELLSLLKDTKVVKIIHAALQDVEAIKYKYGFVMDNIFDTQVALKYLGFGREVGYGKAVKIACNIDIEKSKKIQFSNWMKRPLSEEQIEYAKQDVEFLHKIYNFAIDLFNNEENLDKKEKFYSEMANISLKAKEKFNPYNFWKGKYIKSLNNEQNKKLSELIALREKIARKKNLPREFVIRKTKLIEAVLENSIDRIKFPYYINKDEFEKILC